MHTCLWTSLIQPNTPCRLSVGCIFVCRRQRWPWFNLLTWMLYPYMITVCDILFQNSIHICSYHLNGQWRVNLYGKVRFAGTTWVYERKSLKGEALYTVGPLKEEITIEVALSLGLYCIYELLKHMRVYRRCWLCEVTQEYDSRMQCPGTTVITVKANLRVSLSAIRG